MKLFLQHKPCYIFSAYRYDNNFEVNARDHGFLIDELQARDIPYRVVSGKYKGKFEASVVVDAYHGDTVLNLASQFDQDYVLYLDELRKAWLINVDEPSQTKYIGQWQVVSPRDLGEDDDYTWCPHTGVHYTARQS